MTLQIISGPGKNMRKKMTDPDTDIETEYTSRR